jgi:hypothetical protein
MQTAIATVVFLLAIVFFPGLLLFFLTGTPLGKALEAPSFSLLIMGVPITVFSFIIWGLIRSFETRAMLVLAISALPIVATGQFGIVVAGWVAAVMLHQKLLPDRGERRRQRNAARAEDHLENITRRHNEELQQVRKRTPQD